MENNESLKPLQNASKPEVDITKKENQIKAGANWFYWIAVLSFVNSLISYFQADIKFTIGLGITTLIDVIVLVSQSEVAKFAGIVSSFIIVCFIGFLGYRATKKKMWAFVTGIILYGLDSLLTLWYRDYFSFAFHVFALVIICIGVNALLVLNKFKKNESVMDT